VVASQLAEKFWRPTFVFRRQDGLAQGSARSVPGFPLFQAIQQCEDLVERFGGHEGAAGLTVAVDKLDAFTGRINEVAAQVMGEALPEPELELEGEVELDALTPDVVREFDRLSPFGKGNPQPLFMARNLSLAGHPELVGSSQRHLAFLARQDGLSLRVIAFGKADWLPRLRQHAGPFALAFEPRLDRYAGYERVELRAEDLQCEPQDVRTRG
jgi:single-stranded-DNA-specific exonuclease